MPMVLAMRQFRYRTSGSQIQPERGAVPPEIICSEGLKGLNASAGHLSPHEWGIGWFRAWRNRRMRRKCPYRLTLRFERTSCWRR